MLTPLGYRVKAYVERCTKHEILRKGNGKTELERFLFLIQKFTHFTFDLDRSLLKKTQK